VETLTAGDHTRKWDLALATARRKSHRHLTASGIE